MKIKKEEIIRLLKETQSEVKILGVVPLDADWDDIVKEWAKRTPPPSVTILCESDNMLFSRAFTTDIDIVKERKSFRDLKFIRDAVTNPKGLRRTFNENKIAEKQVAIEIIHLHIPLSAIQVEDRIFVSLWLHEIAGHYEEITVDHPWHSLITGYLSTYFAPGIGRKYSSVPDDEVLELFDHDRVSRGIYPRESFYDTDYSQMVVWVLIFDRQGRLLIHRRSNNAKDNREMWDKSVGGHVEVNDFDTSRTAIREVFEELYKDEMKAKSKVQMWIPTDKETIYVGEWRPEQRGPEPFREIRDYDHEWCYFRLKEPFQYYSPRKIADGKLRRLRVIAEVFLFIAGVELSEDSLGELRNSKYKLLTLSELKTAMDKALRGEEIDGFDEAKKIPEFAPDLVNIMTGSLRDTLEEFSQYVRRYLKNRNT